MTEVAIARCGEYSMEACRSALEEVLEPFGSLGWVKEGMKIVIKANLVDAAKPEKAATTHPTLLAALTKMLMEKGASVVVGDSPGGFYNAAALRHIYSVTGWRK